MRACACNSFRVTTDLLKHFFYFNIIRLYNPRLLHPPESIGVPHISPDDWGSVPVFVLVHMHICMNAHRAILPH